MGVSAGRAAPALAIVASLAALGLVAPFIGDVEPALPDEPDVEPPPPLGCFHETLQIARAHGVIAERVARLHAGRTRHTNLEHQTVGAAMALGSRLSPFPTVPQLTNATVSRTEVCAVSSNASQPWLVLGVELRDEKNVSIALSAAIAVAAVGNDTLTIDDVATIRWTNTTHVWHRETVWMLPDAQRLREILVVAPVVGLAQPAEAAARHGDAGDERSGGEGQPQGATG